MQCERAITEAEFHAMSSQLHPHFLFNALHGISTLVDIDPARAKAMMLKLSSFLRRALEYDSVDLIPLSEELKSVREYLDLEKMRLGNRLAVDWSIHPDTVDVLVPRWILQPLVENAVKHGASILRQGGWVEINARRHEERIEIRIRNSFAEKRGPGTGIGLRNTVARLKYLYSDDATFSFRETDSGTAVARITLPALNSTEAGFHSSIPSRPVLADHR